MKTYPLYLNGEFVVTEKTLSVRNPATGEVYVGTFDARMPESARNNQVLRFCFSKKEETLEAATERLMKM